MSLDLFLGLFAVRFHHLANRLPIWLLFAEDLRRPQASEYPSQGILNSMGVSVFRIVRLLMHL